MHDTDSYSAYENPACPLCDKPGQSYFRMGEYDIDRCPDCNFIYVRNIPSDKDLADCYRAFCGPSADEYIPERRWHKKLKNWWFAQRIKQLARGSGRVLEIGYAHGNLMKALHREPALEAEGIDYAEGPLKHLRSVGLRVTVSSLEGMRYPAESFDVIVGLHVLEHVHNPWYFSPRSMRVFLQKCGFRVMSAHCFSHRAHLTVAAEKN
jgi:SAM-dependent methyltransferase